VVGQAPEKVTTDGHDAYPRAIRETLGPDVRHRTSRYMNNRMEQDHRDTSPRFAGSPDDLVKRIERTSKA